MKAAAGERRKATDADTYGETIIELGTPVAQQNYSNGYTSHFNIRRQPGTMEKAQFFVSL